MSDLPEYWKSSSLNKIASVVDCEHKTAPKINSSKYCSIRTTDIKNGVIDYANANRVSEKTYLKWISRATPSAHDIILAREAPVGEVGWINKNHMVCLGQRTVLIKVTDENIYKKFLLYYLMTRKVKLQFGILSTGSVVPHLNMKDIREYKISCPPFLEQKAIANILTAFDKKIALLQAQNQTLETLAQTVFKEWFVENIALDKVIKSNVKLGGFAENITKSVKPIDFQTGVKYIGLEHIERKNIGLSKNGSGSNVKSNKYKFLEGDILFGKLRPYFHKVCFAPYDGICSTDILVIRARKQQYFGFCLFAFNQIEVVEYAKRSSEGTRMPRTNWKMLSQYLMQPPKDKLIKQFNSIVTPLIKKMKLNLSEVETLTKTRNTLLPKLMSGKTRIRGWNL